MTVIFIIFAFMALFYFIFLNGIHKGLKNLENNHPYGKRETETMNNNSQVPEFVSVIIPFRNEASNIVSSIRSLVNQNYPADRFEVIYVNDNSTDNYKDLLSGIDIPDNIRIISLPEGYAPGAHKKRAVAWGIENSNGEIILSTDCDCTHNPGWIKALTGMYDAKTAFVSGPVKFMDNGTLFHRLQLLEFGGLILTGAGLIGINSPVICSAASLSYRKSIFYKAGGFSDNMNLSSGDDELLMQKIARIPGWKIKFCLKNEAMALTAANLNLPGFFNQRKRWASKGLFYNDKVLILKLIIIYLFYLSIPVQFMAGFILSPLFFFQGAIILSIKTYMEFRILKKGTGLFYKSSVLWLLPLAELLQIPYIIIAGSLGALGNFEWKGRELRR